MARDAIRGYLYSLEKHKESIPSDIDNFVTTIDIESKKQPSKKLTYV